MSEVYLNVHMYAAAGTLVRSAAALGRASFVWAACNLTMAGRAWCYESHVFVVRIVWLR